MCMESTVLVSGTSVAEDHRMPKLEARFHPPDRRGGSYIVVGHITWPDELIEIEPRIELSPMLALAPAPATILATLRHLVRRVGRSPGRLESLRTEHWSFVEVLRPPRPMSPGVQ
jgi:hypothetical protein